MKSLNLLCALLLCVALVGCRHKNVSLTCIPQTPSIEGTELANFGNFGTEDLGFINANGSSVGDVYQLDLTQQKDVFVNPAGHISYDPTKTTEYELKAPATTTAAVAISWKFDASAANQLDASQQATIQAASNKSWKLNLTNASQAVVYDSVALINSDTGNAQLKAEILANKNSIFMILNPTLVGTSSEISVNTASNGSAASSIKIGWNITADVSFTCTSDILRQSVGTTQNATLITYAELVQAGPDGTSIVHAKGLSFPQLGEVQQVMVGGQEAPPPRPKTYASIHFCKRADYDFKNQACKVGQ
jgi:hypothetical protein